MKIITHETGFWVFYMGVEDHHIDPDLCGKWMYFWNDRAFAVKICELAVSTKVVKVAKHSNASSGVACFYIDGGDTKSHRRVLRFFLDNNLIRKTAKGCLYNIPFKYDHQTRAGEYTGNFRAKVRLSDFVDLRTGEFLEADSESEEEKEKSNGCDDTDEPDKEFTPDN